MTMNINEEIKQRENGNDLLDKICRLLFGDSTNLLDELFAQPLSIDYFNVYLSLPIFGQRVLYEQMTRRFDFDPPLLSKSLKNDEQIKEWLMNYRLNDYIQTDIYIESLLGLLLTRIDDVQESSAKSHTFIGSKDTKRIEQTTYVFSTVNDVRQFHRFLQSTSGIKYWDFFIDIMHLLRFRRSSQTNRIDISSLNFTYKYNARQAEFHSIALDLNRPSMPHSGTSDTECFQMAINAMEQLRVYWLPRYLSQSSSSFPLKRKHPMDTISISSSKTSVDTSSIDVPKTTSNVEDIYFIKHRIGNISYIDYNPQEYLFIQPTGQDDLEQDVDPFNPPQEETNQIQKDLKPETKNIPPSDSNRSLKDYANDDNLELFYRIFISDFLAGSPFFQYVSKSDDILHQTGLQFITDVEILFTIPCGTFRERIVRQFILKYLHLTATKELPIHIQKLIEEKRMILIEELTTNECTSYPHLWQILRSMTQFLMPRFLDYVKYDRLRFLIQIKGNLSNPMLILDDLRRIFPSITFEPSLINKLKNKMMDLDGGDSNERELNFESTLNRCGGQQNDLINPWIEKRWTTTEKLINTDEQCEFQIGEHFPPLTDIELEEELNRLYTKFQWKDVHNILGKTFNVSITSHSSDHTTLLGHPPLLESHGDKLHLNSIEKFTSDIINSAREIVEIDRFISNIISEGFHLFQRTSSSQSSPSSPIFEQILSTNSFQSIPNPINNNALDFYHLEHDDQTMPSNMKILSSIGSYFIHRPKLVHLTSQLRISSNLPGFFHETIKYARKDASNDVRNLLINQRTYQGQNIHAEQLLELIENEIVTHPWPLKEYLGLKGHRAWHALKFAGKISHLDDTLLRNYHREFDWIFFDPNLGSFAQRCYVIQRRFS